MESQTCVIKTWTFYIRNGNAFALKLPYQMALDHDGISTIWKYVGIEKKALKLQAFFLTQNCSIDLIS